MVEKKKKIERWVIDYEKAIVEKLRANTEPHSTQSVTFESKEEAVLELRKTLSKYHKRLLKDIEFAQLELTFFEKALANLDNPTVIPEAEEGVLNAQEP